MSSPNADRFMAEALVVLITADSLELARRIAEMLVGERLAACVNIIPQIESIYVWEGEICLDEEFLLIAKTDQASYDLLEAAVRSIHGYDVPEIIALSIDRGSAPYLKWLSRSLER